MLLDQAGLSRQDMAELLNVSHQRVSQLLHRTATEVLPDVRDFATASVIRADLNRGDS